MGIETAIVLAAAGSAMGAVGKVSEIESERKAARNNAREAERNARLSEQKAIEDERRFRLNFRREEGLNIANLGASGIRQEGSPLEQLKFNASLAEEDAVNIRRQGRIESDAYRRQAKMFRKQNKSLKTAGILAGVGGALDVGGAITSKKKGGS